MRAAANFAFANRSVLSHRLRDALKKVFGKDTEAEVVYDVAHNIVRRESHKVNGQERACCVHRKGATRARGGNHPTLEPFAIEFQRIPALACATLRLDLVRSDCPGVEIESATSGAETHL